MAKLATIYGGSGFVGRYIAQRMARQGWRVRVAVRRPNDAHFVKPYGVVGQVEPVIQRHQCRVKAANVAARAVDFGFVRAGVVEQRGQLQRAKDLYGRSQQRYADAYSTNHPLAESVETAEQVVWNKMRSEALLLPDEAL